MKTKITTKWNLQLFYSSRSSKSIESDIKKTEKIVTAFEKKYKSKTDYLKDANKLLRALEDYEKLEADPSGERALFYYLYLKELDSSDSEAISKLTKLEDEFTKLGNKILFFPLKLGRIDLKLQKRFLCNSTLSKYHYFLTKIFNESKYDLTEPEEKILNLKSQTSYSLWVDGVDKLASSQTVTYKKKNMPIAEAMGILSSLKTADRRLLSDLIMGKFKDISDFAESELNAVVLHKKVDDELRGFKQPYSSTILGYENNEKSILGLVDCVTEMNHVAHSFYKIKSKLLGLKTLEYADRNASVGKTKKKISFQDSCDLYREVLKDLDSEYLNIFNSFLNKGHIDVYPQKGKTGGAYCSSSVGLPTMVLLNHTDNLRSYKTLAHEMGHAIHAEMSKKQTPIYQGHSTSVAETASTLFEQLAFEAIFDKLSNSEKVVALHDKISDDINSIFRQIAFFNFERELHTNIRKMGFMPKKQIASTLNKHMETYLGPLFSLKDSDGYFFVAVSHFRRFFYVYSYAYGKIISRAMVEKYKENKNFKNEIRSFLSAGMSSSPEEIFKDIGINTKKPNFFRKGVEAIESDIKALARLL